MGVHDFKYNNVPFFAKKSGNINTSMFAAPKLALVPASRYYCDVTWSYHNVQGVNKVRRHCSITYNFSINGYSILKLYRHTDLFNTKVSTILHLLQLYFI